MKHSVIILLSLAIIGCNGSDHPLSMYEGPGNARVENELIPNTNSLTQSDSDIEFQLKIDNSERKIIKNGFIRIRSEEINKSREFLDSLLNVFDCYKSSESFEDQRSVLSYSLTIRILHTQFDDFIASIEKGNDKVSEKVINSSDVTEQFFDLKSRLENNKKLENRYLELLNKASSIEDIIEIEKSLGQIRGEIESQQGRLNRINNQIAYSTLDIYLFQNKSIKNSGVDRDPFFRSIGISLKQGWNGFIDFIIILIKIWPFWLIGIVIWRIIIYSKNRKKK